jgi:hypothetical protein
MSCLKSQSSKCGSLFSILNDTFILTLLTLSALSHLPWIAVSLPASFKGSFSSLKEIKTMLNALHKNKNNFYTYYTTIKEET